MSKIPNITSVQAKDHFKIIVIFDDGLEKEVDVSPFIKSGVSALLNDQAFFNQVKAENGYITWPNGFDFCPEFLRNYV